MKNKIVLLGAALMSLMPFFTSCVEKDMYDLYDDDNELNIIRKKISKDIGGGSNSLESLYPYSLYPLLYTSDFYYFECAARAYCGEMGCSPFEARVAIIQQQYFFVNNKSYGQYFASVINSNGDTPSLSDLLDALNENDYNDWDAVSVETAMNYILQNGATAFLDKKPIITNSSKKTNERPHVALVRSANPTPLGNNRVKYTFEAIDQYDNTVTSWTVTIEILPSQPIKCKIDGACSMSCFLWKK